MDIQAKLYDLGINSLAMLSAVAVDRDSLESLAKASLGIDINLRPTDAVKFATLFLAWQCSKKRVSELDAEAEVQKAPKPIPALEMQLYKAESSRNDSTN